jgi:2-deoxy-D-gluconate 3-dehydrogenase
LNPFDLSGRVAIVTGGNGGLGLGMARGLARAGAAIAIAARDEKKGQAAVKELSSSAAPILFISRIIGSVVPEISGERRWRFW